jgi:hypothetical protein
MRNCIKSYHVFLSSRLLQVLLYVLYLPVMMFIMLAILCICLDFDGGLSFGYTLSANLIFGGEVIWGYLVFGGVAAKETNKLEYLKTSKKGLPILKKALITDTIRRILWVTAIQWVPLVITMEKPEASVWLANAMVLLFAELGCMLVRKSSSVTMLLAVIMAGTTILSPLLSVTMIIAHQIWPIILCYVLAVAVMVLNSKMVMKKARDSFYDDRNKKMSEAV